MRRHALLILLPLALAACGELRQQFTEYGDKPYNAASIVVPLALTTPPINNVLVGPCSDEMAMPDSRRTNCNLHHFIRGQTPPWKETAARAQAMNYGPGELQCWRTLGTTECIVISGPPRTVNMVGPNLGTN